MALYFFVLLTLLKLAVCLPDPNVNVGVKVDVDDKGCGRGVPCNQKSCSFGGTGWPSGCILTEACFKLKCVDGTWHYTTGDIDSECGECKLEADPHIFPFEKTMTTWGLTDRYLLRRGGDYVISQPDFMVPALFGVNGKFENCDWRPPYNGSCIYEASYYQPGITITLILPRPDIAEKCTIGNPAQDPECDIKVSVNGPKGPFIPIGDSVEYFYGLNGAILVFKHNDIGENDDNLNCITIVGSKGISVSLCEYYKNLPYFYVWALPSLKSNPSTLHGLCNTYTGVDESYLVLQNKTMEPSDECLYRTGADGGGWELCKSFSDSWKANMTSE